MTKPAVTEVLRDKLMLVVERLAFMFVEDDSATLPGPGEGIEVHLSFTGPEDGSFWLTLSLEDCRRIAEGMLGRAIANDETRCQSAPAEFLNVLGNWVLEAIWTVDVEYSVSVPSVRPVPVEQSVACLLPTEQRAVVRTDTGCTLVCGITWGSSSQ